MCTGEFVGTLFQPSECVISYLDSFFFSWNCHLWILGTFGFDMQMKKKETTRHKCTTLDLDETSRTGVGSHNNGEVTNRTRGKWNGTNQVYSNFPYVKENRASRSSHSDKLTLVLKQHLKVWSRWSFHWFPTFLAPTGIYGYGLQETMHGDKWSFEKPALT